MTYPQSSTFDRDARTNIVPKIDSPIAPDEISTVDSPSLSVSLGQRLRAAREARQLEVADCGQMLRLPVRVLKKLEAGDYTGISEAVYLRNYLTSYGACLGLPDDDVRAAIDRLVPAEEKPALVSTGGISRSHYLWHRYTTIIAAAVLTAFVVVPLVWLGLKGGLDRELTRLQPLDSAPVAAQQGAALASASRYTTSTSTLHYAATETSASIANHPADKPLMASMAPFSALDSVDEEMAAAPDQPALAPAQPVAPPTTAVSGSHSLSIDLTQPSWVEVVTANGQRLQYSLLPAGTHKVYHSGQPFHVSIGDAAGASVLLDGKAIDLGTYRHANVAHFRVALQDGQAIIQPGQPG